jgi:ribosomal protein S12 methylthiotransferase
MKLKVGIVTLGCDKNTVDNEYLAGLLEKSGCELIVENTNTKDIQLDAVVVTTCGFIESAKEQSIDTIVELATRKRETGNPRHLFVAGCLAQRYSGDLVDEIPEIDGMVGVGQFQRMAEMILSADQLDQPVHDVSRIPVVDIYQFMHRKRLDAVPHAFLKISDGCNHTCTFCSIPMMKGKLRSVSPEIILEEAKHLLEDGVRELNLVAQDLSMYGMDRWKDYRLPNLIRDLASLPGDFWIRCLYYYPGLVTEEFLRVFSEAPKVVPYLDMPLQHLDPDILKRMKRPFASVRVFDLIERMRGLVPNLTLRTTMICGFPGETDAHHRNMLESMSRLEFDRLGAFRYSDEEGTPACKMGDRVAQETRDQRWHAVMQLQQPISRKLNERRIGEKTRVLVEGYDRDSSSWVTRSPAEAPEIDGKVFLENHCSLKVGDFVDVEITGAGDYDIHARITS